MIAEGMTGATTAEAGGEVTTTAVCAGAGDKMTVEAEGGTVTGVHTTMEGEEAVEGLAGGGGDSMRRRRGSRTRRRASKGLLRR